MSSGISIVLPKTTSQRVEIVLFCISINARHTKKNVSQH